MPQNWQDWPLWVLFPLFFAGAGLRGASLYAIGRGLRGAGERRRSLAAHPAVHRAERLIARYGAPVVSLSFLTVGVQSAVNAAAGLLRMPLRRYLPALLIGALFWATIYTTVGMAVILAFLGRERWTWLAAAVAGVAVMIAGSVVAHRKLGPDRPRRDAAEDR